MVQTVSGGETILQVSILTQPEGWVPCFNLRAWCQRCHLFQSSPNPKVGCHPNPYRLIRSRHVVSILTQPEGWVPLVVYKVGKALVSVSILTQPEGWVPSAMIRQLGLSRRVSILPEGWVP